MSQRLEANRANAKHSTGPKTEAGKSRSKLNALKHGLSAERVVIGDEDPREFEALRAELQRDCQPDTALENELAEQLAGILWRLRRVSAIEAAIVNARQAAAYESVRSHVERETWHRINNEAQERCYESIGATQVQLAVNSDTYAERLEPFRKQVIEEEEKKGGIDASISKEAKEEYQKSGESELVLLFAMMTV
jgi:hypothetical protein